MSNTNSASNLINTLTVAMDRVSQAKDNREINNIIKELLLEFTSSEFATFLLYDQEKQLLYTDRDDRIEISMVTPKGLLGNSYLAKESAIYNHIASEKYYIAQIDNPENSRIKAQIIVPIIKDDNLVGIVRVSRSIRYPKNYTEHDLDLIKSLTPFLVKVSQVLSLETTISEITLKSPQINKEITQIEENKSLPSQSQEDLMLFLSNTVHDIRTPANTLYGFLDLIENQTNDNRLKGYIANAKESASFINQLTDSILNRAKQEYETSKSTITIINSIKFLSQITNSFSANMLNKEIDYTIYIAPSIPKKIAVNTLILKRVLINLIGNAYKFTPRNRSIAFSAVFNKNSKTIKFSIKDSGIGIDKSRQKRIFEAFKQAEDDTDEKFGGTGLGLSISAQYVKELGGELSLISDTDKGSDFYFKIPIEVIDANPSQKPIVVKNKRVTILGDKSNSRDINTIMKYLLSLGMPKELITVSSTLCIDTTHLFCFEDKYNKDIEKLVKERGMELVIIEKTLFGLENNKLFKNLKILSKNSYYGDDVHSTILTENMSRVLVVDDNIINIHLIKAILEDEYCELITAVDGVEAIAKFKDSYLKGEPFDMIFLDKYLPKLSGTEVIEKIRKIEKNKDLNHLFAISITGDPRQSSEEAELFDLLVTKPFKNSEIKDAFHKALKSKGVDS